MDPSLVEVVDQLAEAYPSASPDKLKFYLSEVIEWNHRLGLVSKQTTEAALPRLVRQSAQLLEMCIETAAPLGSVLDVGTGGGFPGAVWASLDPTLDVVMVERKQRKAAFVERTLVVSGIDATIYNCDARDLPERCPAGRFDLVVSMAVADVRDVMELVAGVVSSEAYYATVRPSREGNSPSAVARRELTDGVALMFAFPA